MGDTKGAGNKVVGNGAVEADVVDASTGELAKGNAKLSVVIGERAREVQAKADIKAKADEQAKIDALAQAPVKNVERIIEDARKNLAERTKAAIVGTNWWLVGLLLVGMLGAGLGAWVFVQELQMAERAPLKPALVYSPSYQIGIERDIMPKVRKAEGCMVDEGDCNKSWFEVYKLVHQMGKLCATGTVWEKPVEAKNDAVAADFGALLSTPAVEKDDGIDPETGAPYEPEKLAKLQAHRRAVAAEERELTVYNSGAKYKQDVQITLRGMEACIEYQEGEARRRAEADAKKAAVEAEKRASRLGGGL